MQRRVHLLRFFSISSSSSSNSSTIRTILSTQQRRSVWRFPLVGGPMSLIRKDSSSSSSLKATKEDGVTDLMCVAAMEKRSSESVNQGQFDDAIKDLKTAIDILGRESMYSAMLRSQLAQVLAKAGKLRESFDVSAEAQLEMTRAASRENAKLSLLMGNNLEASGDRSEAHRHYLRALWEVENLRDGEGKPEASELVAVVHFNAAMALDGAPIQGALLTERCLEILRNLGNENHRICQAHIALALFKGSVGKDEESRQHLRTALTLCEKELEEENHRQESRRRREEKEATAAAATTTVEEKSDDDMKNTSNSNSSKPSSTSSPSTVPPEKSIEMKIWLCRHLISGALDVMFSNKPIDTFMPDLNNAPAAQDQRCRAAVLTAFGCLFEGRKDYKMALEFYETALRARMETKDSELVVQSLSDMGAILIAQGDINNALSVFFVALVALRDSYGTDHNSEDFAVAFENAANALSMSGKKKEALSFLRPALTMWRELHGEESMRVATTLRMIMRAELALQNTQEAYTNAARALKIMRKIRPHPVHLSEMTRETGELLILLGKDGEGRVLLEESERWRRLAENEEEWEKSKENELLKDEEREQ